MKTKEQVTKPTPTPWRISEKPQLGTTTRIIPKGNEFFTVAATSGFNKPEADANAELICRAVNSFEAMREFICGVDEIIRMGKPSDVLWNYCVEKREAVLALAEGKAVQS